ncbi:DUF4336 domain-containing protein [filamentous cyanobacterium LEGE 11480]|uniref:DUF4336 domain-containing protein n=1 Tax=Romeriopsis navalis LEGE 11480 TaxID=2777977 RepID=A0A928VNT9_9CYAN|nr:DUF4336 domain-containing protein [Romeriopsis navalis]MBE9030131.1 DUF4336 domain-containing protein [Romeriopsis navalis LEGE 11480]
MTSQGPLQTPRDPDQHWPFWFTVPLYPFSQRRTIRRELVPETIWSFDQLQGILYVVTPIRMTIVRLAAGGLLVYAPVAPTKECLRLVNDLVEQYGEIKYIILPTTSGLEHKVFVGPFARKFPSAQVFVAPNQWSFPVNLPLAWLGLPWGRTQKLPKRSSDAPFGDEFDYAMLGPIGLGLGAFEEVAMLHRASQTLLLTDSVVAVPEQPPAIIAAETRAMLFHARDHVSEVVADTPANRLKGWQRIALFSFYFRPSAAGVVSLIPALKDLKTAPDRSRQNYYGLYPFQWQSDWKKSFDALRGEGRLFVAPILQRLILNRDPREAIDWANTVAQWDFRRIITCHMEAPIATNAQEFRAAFSFLEKHPQQEIRYPLPEADFELLRQLEAGLDRTRITPPAQEKV